MLPIRIISALFITIVIVYSSATLAKNNSENTPPLSAYAQLPEKSLMTISPSGKRLAYRDITEKHDLMVVIDLTTKKMLSGIQLNDVNPNDVYFVDDNQLILVASESKRLIGFRGRHNVSAAFSFNLETNSLHQLLTPGYRIYSGQSAVGIVVGVSPDKRYAYMPAYANSSLYHLYKVDLEKRRKPKVLIKGGPDTIDFFVDPKGNVLARERFNNDLNEHKIEARIDDEWVTIYQEKTNIRTKGFSGITPDYQHLVMRAYDRKTDRWGFYTMALADGKISDAIFSDPNKDVEKLLTDVNRVVYGVEYSGFKPTYEFFDAQLNGLLTAINKAVPEQSLTINNYTPDWQSILFYMDGKESSGDYLLFKDGGFDYIAAARPEIKPQHVNTIQELTITARDGLSIPTLLTLPNGLEAKHLPTIVMPHGGPASYDRASFDWLTQYLSAQGYAVVQPQFRGSTGFGEAHRWAGHGEWGQKMQWDLDDAVAHLTKQGITDPNRVCILGSSYGGYASLAGVTFSPKIYKCAVSINGVSDINRMLTVERRKYGSNHWVVEYWDEIIKSGKFDADHLRAISPITHAQKIEAPLLLIHGKLDQVVRIEQSENMVDELKDFKKDVTFVELENSNHYLLHNQDRIKALQAIDAFLKQNL